MAAPLGFKTFNTGDVLSAADTNGYLMQGVLVFADAAARSAAITSPQEGQTSYLKDTDVIQVYSGAAWVTKSGGSSPLTTKGDLYTYSTTDARLAVGTNGHTLVADSSTATGLKWAAPAGGAGLTLVKTVTIGSSASTVAVTDAFSATYDNYKIIVSGGVGSNDSNFNLQLGATTSNYGWYEQLMTTSAPTISGAWIGNTSSFAFGKQSTSLLNGVMEIQCPFLAKATTMTAWGIRNVATVRTTFHYGIIDNSTSYTDFTIISDANMTGGTIKVYGYANS